MYISTLYEEKNRLRPLPLPSELSKRIWELNRKQILLVGYELKPIEIVLPWLIVRDAKKQLLKANRDDILGYIGFLMHDVGNTILRMLLPSIPSIMFRDPKELEVIDHYIEFKEQKIKTRRIIATGFTIWPSEKPTISIVLTCELYDIPDELDSYNLSRCKIIIDLRKLLEELNIRWDIGRG